MFVSCNETKQNGLEDDMIQWKRCWCCNITNVGEKSRKEGLCSYQMGGETFGHLTRQREGEANARGEAAMRSCLLLFVCRMGFVRLCPDSLFICRVRMTIHVRKNTTDMSDLLQLARFPWTGPFSILHCTLLVRSPSMCET